MTSKANHSLTLRAALLMLTLVLCISPLAGAFAAEAATADTPQAQAEEIALTHAGLTADAVANLYTELDRNGQVEVRFTANDSYYEYEVCTNTNTILEYSIQNTVATANAIGKTGDAVSSDAARDAALAHAGFSAADVTVKKVKLDTDDGITCYEVEFETADAEYEYKIGAFDGAVLECGADFFNVARKTGAAGTGVGGTGSAGGYRTHHQETRGNNSRGGYHHR